MQQYNQFIKGNMKKIISFAAFCIMVISGALFTSCLNGEDEIDVYADLQPGKAIVATVNMTNDSKFDETELKPIAEFVNKLAGEIKKEQFNDCDAILNLCKSRIESGVDDLPEATKVKLKRYQCEIGLFGYYLSLDSKQMQFTYIFKCGDELTDVKIPEEGI